MKLLTIEQTAEMLAVSVTTVRTMLERLGAVDLSQGGRKRLLRIPEANVERYIRECTICGTEKRTVTDWRIERRRA